MRILSPRCSYTPLMRIPRKLGWRVERPWLALMLGPVPFSLRLCRDQNGLGHVFYRPTPIIAKRVPHLPLASPTVDILSDSTTSNVRQLSLRVRASAGTTALGMLVTDAPVISATIDGRAIDTKRYGLRPPRWHLG